MTKIVDWASARARMVLAFIVLSLAVGGLAYSSLPKEGEPDIEVPVLIISMPFQGISAADSETLLIKPMENELADLDDLKTLTATAADNFAAVVLEFEFGWDKAKAIADVRDRMNKAEANFPTGGDKYTINEFNFSQFPIVVISLSGGAPERTLIRLAKNLQDRLERLEPVLNATLTGVRDEMLEVVIDPLKLEAYNITAQELISIVQNNNQLIPAGDIDSESANFSVKIPSSFDEPQDIYALPIKINGDRIVTVGDIADIRLTFEDQEGVARFNGAPSVSVQVVKRKGFNLIDTVELVRQELEKERALWPEELKTIVTMTPSNDSSEQVRGMISQLEGSVLTATALVMIVVLAALGTRPALLVGFAIPTSFLLCFAFLALMGVTISNMVMFGLILAVGILVDSAIVVVEYADKRIRSGTGPMQAYVDAAKRMFWPIVSSTATTLCAFLPMLFWPGVPGEFMGMLPVTLIFVLTASLVVALIYLPVMGGVSGRLSRILGNISGGLRSMLPWWLRAVLVLPALYTLFSVTLMLLRSTSWEGVTFAIVLFIFTAFACSVILGAVEMRWRQKKVHSGYQRTRFGSFIKFIVANPIMPLVSIGMVAAIVVFTFIQFGQNSKGVEFFVDIEPDQSIVYLKARGNLSLEEKDEILRQAEEIILSVPGIKDTFTFAGDGGLNSNTGGASAPLDTIAQAQIEYNSWEDRQITRQNNNLFGFLPWTTYETNNALGATKIIPQLQARLNEIPGIEAEIFNLSSGPADSKPLHLRIKGNNWDDLTAATQLVRKRFDATDGLSGIEDTLPLPGIDWKINVDVSKAGRYGTNVATVGGMVQLVTRGIFIDTMRVDSSDEEIEIRVRFPEQDRVLSTLDTLKVRTQTGLVPLSNFVTREPVRKLGQINRVDQKRYFDVKAGIKTGAMQTITAEDGTQTQIPYTANGRIAEINEWLESTQFAPGVEWEWTGDQQEQAESSDFLMKAFAGALGLMFIILLAQFNSVYNSLLILLAVILSTTGVLWGMLIMDQAFSIIMTGTGIVALAGIVVNNNIVLIDTYQEYNKYMPRIEAIIRTAEARIRPVLLTTITTMAGLTPMMLGLSLNFFDGGYSIDSPSALWWKQLATAVVFGLGAATGLTLVITPALLALRVWMVSGAYGAFIAVRAGGRTKEGRRIKADLQLNREARKTKERQILWEEDLQAGTAGQ